MDNKITYFTRKENQYFLTREEIHNTFQKYIQDYKGKVITKKNGKSKRTKIYKNRLVTCFSKKNRKRNETYLFNGGNIK